MKTKKKTLSNFAIDSKDYPVEHFLKLYELQLTSFNGRRTTFWTITLSIWTAIVLVTGFLYGKLILPCWILWVFYSFLFGFVSFWLYKVWYADKCDHDWWEYYRNIAEFKLGIQKKNIKTLDDIDKPNVTTNEKQRNKQNIFWKFISNGWSVIELGFTLLLIISSILLLCNHCSK